MIFKKFLSISIIIFLTGALNATMQFDEKITLNGETWNLVNRPLESFFTKNNPRPKNLFKVSSSALWRGYIGKYLIKDNRLYLDNLLNGDIDSTPIKLIEICNTWKSPQFCYWYTGELYLRKGKIIGFNKHRYEPICEDQIYLNVIKGVIENADNK